MKPNHDFTAQRALAQHCPELVQAAMAQHDVMVTGAAMMRDIAANMGCTMLPVASGADIRVTCKDPVRGNSSAFINRMGRQMAHCVIGAGEERRDGPALMLSVGHGEVHILTDRAYGGTGEAADPLPAELPISADLTLRQLEAAWCAAICQTLPSGGAFETRRRGADIGRLDPFRGQLECIQFDLTVEQDGHTEWAIAVSASVRDLTRLAACHGGMDGANDADPGKRAGGDPAARPFGDIALPTRAVLAETPITLARASMLAVGDVIPLSIACDVPLTIAGTAIARGSIGTQNDCVALQITTVS